MTVPNGCAVCGLFATHLPKYGLVTSDAAPPGDWDEKRKQGLLDKRALYKKIKDDKDSDEAKKFSDLIIGYKMLRAFCISHNWISCNKEEDKRFIPSKF